MSRTCCATSRTTTTRASWPRRCSRSAVSAGAPHACSRASTRRATRSATWCACSAIRLEELDAGGGDDERGAAPGGPEGPAPAHRDAARRPSARRRCGSRLTGSAGAARSARHRGARTPARDRAPRGCARARRRGPRQGGGARGHARHAGRDPDAGGARSTRTCSAMPTGRSRPIAASSRWTRTTRSWCCPRRARSSASTSVAASTRSSPRCCVPRSRWSRTATSVATCSGAWASLCQNVLDDTDGAIKAWRSRLEESPGDEQALAALDRLYEQTERWRELVEVIERRRDIADDGALRRKLMTRAAEILSDKLQSVPEAIDAWRAVIDEFGPDAESLSAIEKLYESAERWDELGESYEVHLDIAEDDARAAGDAGAARRSASRTPWRPGRRARDLSPRAQPRHRPCAEPDRAREVAGGRRHSDAARGGGGAASDLRGGRRQRAPAEGARDRDRRCRRPDEPA